MDTFDFAPRGAIVTASDSGIGQATALALADAGMGPQAGSHLTDDSWREG